MTRARSVLGASVAIVLAALLAACGGLPISGPVNAGQPITDDDSSGGFVFIPDGPTRDATPQQIVEGFLAAGSGPQNSWQTAKEFLAPSFRTQWDPRAGVTVYRPGGRVVQAVSDSEITVTVSPVATVDATGALSTSEGGDIPLPFTLAQQDDGQWRITQAPGGIVLDRNRFTAVYRAYALQFFDPTWTYLVPDERWFPQAYAATSIAAALVDGGPSPWLQGAVATAFSDGARLAQTAVPVRSDKVASVSLQPGARDLGLDVRARMQTQLDASLEAAGIRDVDMLVDDQPLTTQAAPVRQTGVEQRPLVRTAAAFGFVSGSVIDAIPGLSAAMLQVAATDIEVNADRTSAAVRDTAGEVLRISSDGEQLRLDTRSGLVPPSIDPRGYIWSVPSGAPAAVRAFGPDGTEVDVPGAWAGASAIAAQRVSRDGTRIAAIVRTGDRYELWAAGILRDRDGVPVGFGEQRKALAVLPGPATALTWADASTLAVVLSAEGEPTLFTQEVGGFAETQRTPNAVTTAAGGTLSGGLRLRDATGEIYALGGANWQHLASGVVVLAIQQGSPD